MSGAVVSALLLSILMIATPGHMTVITIQNPIPTPLAFFGQYIDAANGYLAVGNPSYNGGQGAVSIYNITNGSMIYTIPGLCINPCSKGGFGRFVEIAGNLLITGAPGETVNGLSRAGRVYIVDATTGALLNTLISSSPEHDGFFGAAVSLAGGLLAVGAPNESVNGFPAGRVHIFNIQTGTETMTLGAPYPRPGPRGTFGLDLSIADGRIIVGAPGDFAARGHAYVFDSATGALLNTLFSPINPIGFSFYFGSSVALRNDRAFVGSPDETIDGVAYFGGVYEFNIFTGSLVRTFSDPMPATEAGGFFGRSIALAANNLIVGSPYDNATTFGQVYLFGADSGQLKRTLLNPAASTGCFGNSVDSTKSGVIVGDPCQVVNGQFYAGAVYIFSGVISHGQSGFDQNQP